MTSNLSQVSCVVLSKLDEPKLAQVALNFSFICDEKSSELYAAVKITQVFIQLIIFSKWFSPSYVS